MITNFKTRSISRLLAQRGEVILFGTETTQDSSEDLDWGIAPSKQLTYRRVRGLTQGESAYSLGLGVGTKTMTGDYSCWIMCVDVQKQEFTGSARIIRDNGKIYQIKYESTILDRNVPQFHVFKLIATPEAESINLIQPDEVFDNPNQ